MFAISTKMYIYTCTSADITKNSVDIGLKSETYKSTNKQKIIL